MEHITDLSDFLKATDPELKLATSVWADGAARKDEIHSSRSAIRWPEKIKKPILIMHGEADADVSPLHSLKIAGALAELKNVLGVSAT